eukprot:NODE_661_length_4933_cov_0.690112.p2 type:complete len:252 gc:universal NODE_661_length_4933_cov_0.690112:3634-4389(+)
MEVEINKLRTQLKKHIEDKEAINIIKELENIKVNPEILKKTKIGVFIKSINNSDLKPYCDQLIKKWRQDVAGVLQPQPQIVTDNGSNKSNERSFKNEVQKDLNLPEIRLKSVQFFYNALVLEDAKMELALAISMKVEAELYKTFHGPEYKDKTRAIYLNLKSNEKLRSRVLLEEIAPQKLISMKSEDLANDAIKQANEEEKEKLMKDSMAAQSQQASTDQFMCGKCKQRKTTYYQMQTRSADEPMTTFVTF